MKEQTWKQWVRLVIREKKENPEHPSRLFDGCMAPLTGTDYRALEAFAACLKLSSYCDRPEQAIRAMRIVLGEMQPSVRWIARELIPFAKEWNDRERMWPRLALNWSGSELLSVSAP